MDAPSKIDVDPARYISLPEAEGDHPALGILREIAEPSDPYPDWEEKLREGDPQLQPGDDGGYVARVYGWESLLACFQHPGVGLSRGYREYLQPTTGKGMHCTDPPEHTELRSFIEPMFQEEVQRVEDQELRKIARRLTGNLRGSTRFEFLNDFAIHFPPRVIARILGLPDDHLKWYQHAVYRFSTAYLFTRLDLVEQEFLDRSSRELRLYYEALLEDLGSSGDPPPGLLSRLVHERRDGRRLEKEQILPFLLHLAPASGTSAMALGSILYGLLTHPRQHRLLQNDLSLASEAVEEGLRWESPFAIVERQAHEPIAVNGTDIPGGTLLMLHIASANHDPTRFERPHEFDFTRSGGGHLSFAAGPHVCLGKQLALREMETAIRVFYEEIGDFRIDPERRDEAFRAGGFWRGIVQLPIQVGQSPSPAGT